MNTEENLLSVLVCAGGCRAPVPSPFPWLSVPLWEVLPKNSLLLSPPFAPPAPALTTAPKPELQPVPRAHIPYALWGALGSPRALGTPQPPKKGQGCGDATWMGTPKGCGCHGDGDSMGGGLCCSPGALQTGPALSLTFFLFSPFFFFFFFFFSNLNGPSASLSHSCVCPVTVTRVFR